MRRPSARCPTSPARARRAARARCGPTARRSTARISSRENSETVSTVRACGATARVSHRRRSPSRQSEPLGMRAVGHVVHRDDDRAGRAAAGPCRPDANSTSGRSRNTARRSRICSHHVPATVAGSTRHAKRSPNARSAADGSAGIDHGEPVRRRRLGPLPHDFEEITADARRTADQFASVDHDVQRAISHARPAWPGRPAPTPAGVVRQTRAS